MSSRPKRTIKPPKSVYVPDEHIEFIDDDDGDDEEVDLEVESDEEEEDDEPNEYQLDDFLVADDDIEYEEGYDPEHPDGDMDIDDGDEEDDMDDMDDTDEEDDNDDEFYEVDEDEDYEPEEDQERAQTKRILPS